MDDQLKDLPYGPLPSRSSAATIASLETFLKDRATILSLVMEKTYPHWESIISAVRAEVKMKAWQCICRQQHVDTIFAKHGFEEEWTRALEKYASYRSHLKSAGAFKATQPREKSEKDRVLKRALSLIYAAAKAAEEKLEAGEQPT